MAASGAAVGHAPTGLKLIPRPGLFELLNAAERVVLVSAPAGSGKTFLLRSWIAAEGLGERTAWVSVGRGEHDPQAFWLSILDALRGTRVGAGRVRELTAAPGLDGATVLRRLLEDLGSLLSLQVGGEPRVPFAILVQGDGQTRALLVERARNAAALRGDNLELLVVEVSQLASCPVPSGE
jgi:hypothetical protein